MSPVATDLASADSAPTEEPVPVPGAALAADDELCLLELFEVEDFEEPPQPAAKAASAATKRRTAAGRSMPRILQEAPEKLLNAG
jgi:hypothetical protein